MAVVNGRWQVSGKKEGRNLQLQLQIEFHRKFCLLLLVGWPLLRSAQRSAATLSSAALGC